MAASLACLDCPSSILPIYVVDGLKRLEFHGTADGGAWSESRISQLFLPTIDHVEGRHLGFRPSPDLSDGDPQDSGWVSLRTLLTPKTTHGEEISFSDICLLHEDVLLSVLPMLIVQTSKVLTNSTVTRIMWDHRSASSLDFISGLRMNTISLGLSSQ